MLAMMLNNPIKWNISADLWKKTFPNWLFSYWNIIEKDTFGSSERLPPLSGPLPTNKNTYPPIRKPPPIHSVFFFLLGCLCNCFLLGRLHLHVLYFQPVWFQRFLVAWLIMLIWSDLLSLQELCFHWVQAALLPTRLVPEVPCGLAHHVDMKWLAFTSRSVLPLGTSLDYCQPD